MALLQSGIQYQVYTLYTWGEGTGLQWQLAHTLTSSLHKMISQEGCAVYGKSMSLPKTHRKRSTVVDGFQSFWTLFLVCPEGWPIDGIWEASSHTQFNGALDMTINHIHSPMFCKAVVIKFHLLLLCWVSPAYIILQMNEYPHGWHQTLYLDKQINWLAKQTETCWHQASVLIVSGPSAWMDP